MEETIAGAIDHWRTWEPSFSLNRMRPQENVYRLKTGTFLQIDAAKMFAE